VPATATVGHQKTAVTGEYEPVENEDYASFAAQFADAVGTLQMSRIAFGQPNGLSFEIYCENGSARFDEDRPNEAEFTIRGAASEHERVVFGGLDEESWPLPHPDGRGDSHADDFIYQAMAFVQEVVGYTGDDTYFANATFADGLHNMRVLDAVAESALNNGRKVDL
jgi:predicted dehydrogenase